MPTRRELKGVAAGIVGNFISRNNDLEGYWALGLLYKEVREKGKKVFRLNLISGDSEPVTKYSKQLASRYSEVLGKQIKKRGLSAIHVEEAMIEMEFNTTPTKMHVMYKQTWGEPFVCRVRIRDDLKKEHFFEGRGWCGCHDPKRERRSARV